jgi:photosystem II stability/assembly factor-like uncharacterized protein
MKKFLILLIATLSLNIVDAQWIQTNGPIYGDINCIETVENQIYAGTSNGLFLSTDSGKTWNLINNSLANLDIRSIAINNQDIVVGTSSHLYLSKDNGANWQAADSDLISTAYYNSIAFSGKNIFVACDMGFYLSTNNGDNWQGAHGNGLTSDLVYSIATDGSNIYVGCSQSGGMFLSTDNGTNWHAINNGLPDISNVFDIVVSESKVYIGTSKGVFLSTDNGASWKNIGLSNSAVTSLAVSDGNIIAGMDGGKLFISTDSGSSWQAINKGLSNLTVKSISILGKNIYVGTYHGGMFKSADYGTNWQAINSGLIYGKYASVSSLASSDSIIFAGCSRDEFGGIYFSNDHGLNWNISNNSFLGEIVKSIQVSGNNIFAGVFGKGVFLSTDNGLTWKNMGFTGLTTTHQVNTLAINGSNIYVGAIGGMFRSTDNGTNWKEINNGIIANNINAIATDGINTFIGTSQFYEYPGGVYLSTNNGESWQYKSNGSVWHNKDIMSLVLSGTRIFAGTYYGFLVSNDSGASWTDTGINDIIKSFAVSGTNIFAGAYSGQVYLSTNNGVSWKHVDTGLPAQNLNSLKIFGDYIFAGLNNSGVWKRSISELTGIEEKNKNMDIVIYPNPAVDEITITVAEIYKNSILTILDNKGQELIRHQMQDSKMKLDISSLKSGIYFVKLLNEKTFAVRKILKE